MEKELKEVKECVQRIEKAITGDMNDSKNPGIITRLDRLEQSKKFKDKILWILTANLVVLALERFF